MKKFTKVSLITAVIIMFLGIILFIAGVAGGGQEEVSRMERNGELSFFNNHLRIDLGIFTGDEDFTFGVGVFDDETVEAPEAPETLEKSDQLETAGTSAVMTGNEEAALNAEGVKNLQIALGGGALFIEVGDVENIQIITDCEDEFRGYIKNNTFYIEGFGIEDGFLELEDWNGKDNTVRIILPMELAFKETTVSMGAGIIEITDVTLGDTQFEIGAGEVTCNNTKSEELIAEVGAGTIYMEDIEADETDITVAMGEAVLKGIFNRDIDVECSMGNVEIEIDGKKEEFNYSVEASMGSVEIDGESYEGIASEKDIDRGADKTIDAETAMGNIEISFTK